MDLELSTIGRIAAVGLLGYLLYGLIAYLVQDHLVYPGRLGVVPGGGETGRGRVRAAIRARVSSAEVRQWRIKEREARVEAWLIRPAEARATSPVPAVVAAHGNAETAPALAEEASGFVQRGWAVLLVEYPGYGGSIGDPGQALITRLFARGYDRLVAREDVASGRVIGYGRSLGGGVVAQLAARRPLAGLILQSTPASLDGFARRFGLPAVLLRDSYDTLEVLRSFDGPVLLLHGRHDRQVPFSHARRLARATADARLVAYECGHNDCPPDRGSFWNDVDRYIARIVESTAHDDALDSTVR